MPAEDINVPPIVKELAGSDNARLGIAAQAYNSLWKMYACGRNGDLRNKFIEWMANPNHSWLEEESILGEPTPLVKLRRAIEAERQRLLAKGLDPCSDFNLN